MGYSVVIGVQLVLPSAAVAAELLLEDCWNVQGMHRATSSSSSKMRAGAAGSPEAKMGRPRCVLPPFLGFTPPTICVPYLMACGRQLSQGLQLAGV